MLTNSKLSGRQCPKKKAEKSEMNNIPYASIVESMIYAMVCTRMNIAYVFEVVS